MAKPDWTALVALSEADRQRALEQFYWLRPVLEEGVPLQGRARDGGVPVRKPSAGYSAISGVALLGSLTEPVPIAASGVDWLRIFGSSLKAWLCVSRRPPSRQCIVRCAASPRRAAGRGRAMPPFIASSRPWTQASSHWRTMGRNGTRTSTSCFIDARRAGRMRCGKPITRHLICGWSMNAAARPDRG
jgi:hypothetical protein